MGDEFKIGDFKLVESGSVSAIDTGNQYHWMPHSGSTGIMKNESIPLQGARQESSNTLNLLHGAADIEPKWAGTKLNAGDFVQIKSAEEIIAGLDQSDSLDNLPFMPEMLKYCGKRFRVFKSAHKTHDTIAHKGIRRMANAVHLEGLRCDGSYHGGCQAGCLLFWKMAWLEPIGTTKRKSVEGDQHLGKEIVQKTLDSSSYHRLVSGAVYPDSPDGVVRYRCQATEMLNATTNVRRRERWDPRFYLRDVTSRNVALWDFFRFGALAMLNAFLFKWFHLRFPHIRPRAGQKAPTCELNLQPGELVRVKQKRNREDT
jgi:hypothetical protein